MSNFAVLLVVCTALVSYTLHMHVNFDQFEEIRRRLVGADEPIEPEHGAPLRSQPVTFDSKGGAPTDDKAAALSEQRAQTSFLAPHVQQKPTVVPTEIKQKKMRKSMSVINNNNNNSNNNSSVGSSVNSVNSAFQNPIAMIKCVNQTRCIQPVLQLKEHYNVYYCKHVSHGVRFYFLVREGLLLHPNIHLVDTPEDADIVMYLPESAVWHKTECADPKYRSKLLVLDEGDHPTLFSPGDGDKVKEKVVMTFKRSYVRRGSGIFQGYMPYVNSMEILPMTYTILDAYVRNEFNTLAKRDNPILCTLRGSNSDPVRLRVRQWVEEYQAARGLKGAKAGQVNSASRPSISKQYFESMYKSQIIVTSNPSGWEGDFRLCEALATGALIFVDQMYVPRPSPLRHNQHYIVYDNNNKTDLFEKLDLYRKETELARRIAVNGYLHTLTYHRAASLIDYVFRTLSVLREAQKSSNAAAELDQLATKGYSTQTATLGYTDTGYHMRAQAVAAANVKPKEIAKKWLH